VADHGSRFGAPHPEAWGVSGVADAASIAAAIDVVRENRLAEDVSNYVVALVRATRESAELEAGASPRAASMLAGAARARAALDGRNYVVPDDVKALAPAVLRHRVILSPTAQIEGQRPEGIIARLIEHVEAPR
jgi:MoxR-like ATPase